MTDPSASAAPPASYEDRLVPAAVYVLYLVGTPTLGVTILVGLVVAYASIGAAGPVMRSHYRFQIRTFWLSLAWGLVGLGLVLLGGLLMIVLIGFPIFHLGVAILGLGWLWFLVRSVAGGLYLLQGQAYPRPQSWLI